MVDCLHKKNCGHPIQDTLPSHHRAFAAKWQQGAEEAGGAVLQHKGLDTCLRSLLAQISLSRTSLLSFKTCTDLWWTSVYVNNILLRHSGWVWSATNAFYGDAIQLHLRYLELLLHLTRLHLPLHKLLAHHPHHLAHPSSYPRQTQSHHPHAPQHWHSDRLRPTINLNGSLRKQPSLDNTCEGLEGEV